MIFVGLVVVVVIVIVISVFIVRFSSRLESL